MPESILELSKRTVTKVMQRLNLGCSNCGWKITTCDIHHILPRSKGGSDEHSNLTNLCPNCHRCAHAGILTTFITLDEQIGDRWREFYYPGLTKTPKIKKKRANNILRYAKEKQQEAKARALKVLPILKESDIDFTKFGWVKHAAEIIGIKPNKVNQWLKKHDPEFLDTCFVKK